MLSKDDVDRMVNEAREHAEEDRQRREEVETRNQADALAFQAERTLRDLGDKVASADKADVEQKADAVREALKGNDLAAVRSSADALATALQKVGAAAYESAGAAAGSSSSDGAAEDETVEGEYKEV
jgi:molecular chaperone DnaK